MYDFKDEDKAFIGNVVIQKSSRGKGLGKQIIHHMVNAAFLKYGLGEVHISVFSDNITALLLYLKLGFQPYSIEERQNYQAKRVALIHMKLDRPSKNSNAGMGQAQ